MKREQVRAMVRQGPVEVAGRRGAVKPTRGYSLIELKRAGLSQAQAEALDLPVDPQRKTGIGANVVRLREWV